MILEMKRENHLNMIFNNQLYSANITNEHVLHVQEITKDYVQNKMSEIEFMHFSDYILAMKVFKEMYNKLENEKFLCEEEAYDKAYDNFCNTKTVLRKDSGQSIKAIKKLFIF